MEDNTKEVSIYGVVSVCVTICFYVLTSSMSSCADSENTELKSKNRGLSSEVSSLERSVSECFTNISEMEDENKKMKEELKYKNILSEIVGKSMKASDDKLSAIKEIMK